MGCCLNSNNNIRINKEIIINIGNDNKVTSKEKSEVNYYKKNSIKNKKLSSNSVKTNNVEDTKSNKITNNHERRIKNAVKKLKSITLMEVKNSRKLFLLK